MLRVVLGSYERLLYGLDVTKDGETGSYNVAQTFTYPAHIASIRSVAVSRGGKHLATGASDEHVKIYSLSRNKETGTLFHHTGSITDLVFHDTGYLFTASEDATIAIVRVSDWEVLKVLKGHTTALQSISIHPSGKLLLSVSIDGYLRTWDTAKASCAYTLKMPLPRPVSVLWSQCGRYYSVAFESGVTCTEVASGKEIWRETGLGRITCIEFVEMDNQPTLLVAGDSKTITAYKPTTRAVAATLPASHKHASRIKDMSAAVLDGVQVLVTCSSEGFVCGWDLARAVEAGSLTEEGVLLFEFEAKVRLTCCQVVYQAGGGRKKKGMDELEDLDEDLGDDEVVGDQHASAPPPMGTKKSIVTTAGKKGRVVVSYDNVDEAEGKEEGTSQDTTSSGGAPKKAKGANKNPFKPQKGGPSGGIQKNGGTAGAVVGGKGQLNKNFKKK
ncbi:WD40-repeat-containing domain protein [Chytriomyces sp. MP71]|nr:WD40-repeat-containing domain protein [Chytriomyces sp. MP71]